MKNIQNLVEELKESKPMITFTPAELNSLLVLNVLQQIAKDKRTTDSEYSNIVEVANLVIKLYSNN